LRLVIERPARSSNYQARGQHRRRCRFVINQLEQGLDQGLSRAAGILHDGRQWWIRQARGRYVIEADDRDFCRDADAVIAQRMHGPQRDQIRRGKNRIEALVAAQQFARRLVAGLLGADRVDSQLRQQRRAGFLDCGRIAAVTLEKFRNVVRCTAEKCRPPAAVAQ